MINAATDEEDSALFFITMTFPSVSMDDAGTYYCHANNSLGSDVAPMEIRVTDSPPSVINVTECCQNNNVSAR